VIDRFGLTNLGALQEKLSTGMVQGGQFVAAKALNIGQNTFDFIVNLGTSYTCCSFYCATVTT
jgi:hypothetical protein